MKSKLMTGFVLVTMVAMLISFLPLTAPANISMANAEDTEMRLVTVNGEGKIVVTPDLAYIDLGVQTKNKDAAVAQQENAKLMTAVVNAIKAAGVKAEDIKTTGYNLYQTSDYSH